METIPPPFKTFEQLETYKVARQFRIDMYAVSRRLPDFEKFGLTSQMRRAALSLTNNIAEGHGRWQLEQWLANLSFETDQPGSPT